MGKEAHSPRTSLKTSPTATTTLVNGGGGGGDAGRRNSHGWTGSLRAHSRKISDALSKPLGYEKVMSGRTSREGSPYEMRALMDPSRTVVGGAAQVEGKMSADSFSVDGSDGERDGGKMMERRAMTAKI